MLIRVWKIHQKNLIRIYFWRLSILVIWVYENSYNTQANYKFWSNSFLGPNYLCKDKDNGNYEYSFFGVVNPHYFLQCSNGIASCQTCWPGNLFFRADCNQCLFNYDGKLISLDFCMIFAWENFTSYKEHVT